MKLTNFSQAQKMVIIEIFELLTILPLLVDGLELNLLLTLFDTLLIMSFDIFQKLFFLQILQLKKF